MKALADLLEIADRQGNLVETSYTCEDCRDTGWRVKPDGGPGAAERCPCSLKRGPGESRQALIFSGLKRSEIYSAFTPWDEAHQPKPSFAREWLTWVLRGAVEDEAPASVLDGGRLPVEPWILTLFGKPGRGKTKTAAVLARVYSEEGGRQLVWANATAAFDRVQRERSRDGWSSYEKEIADAGLLIVDDFGLSHRRDGETLDSTVAHWLYQRHRDQLPSVIVTNAESFADLKDARISSRIAAGVYRTMRADADFRDRGSERYLDSLRDPEP